MSEPGAQGPSRPFDVSAILSASLVDAAGQPVPSLEPAPAAESLTPPEPPTPPAEPATPEKGELAEIKARLLKALERTMFGQNEINCPEILADLSEADREKLCWEDREVREAAKKAYAGNIEHGLALQSNAFFYRYFFRLPQAEIVDISEAECQPYQMELSGGKQTVVRSYSDTSVIRGMGLNRGKQTERQLGSDDKNMQAIFWAIGDLSYAVRVRLFSDESFIRDAIDKLSKNEYAVEHKDWLVAELICLRVVCPHSEYLNQKILKVAEKTRDEKLIRAVKCALEMPVIDWQHPTVELMGQAAVDSMKAPVAESSAAAVTPLTPPPEPTVAQPPTAEQLTAMLQEAGPPPDVSEALVKGPPVIEHLAAQSPAPAPIPEPVVAREPLVPSPTDESAALATRLPRATSDLKIPAVKSIAEYDDEELPIEPPKRSISKKARAALIGAGALSALGLAGLELHRHHTQEDLDAARDQRIAALKLESVPYTHTFIDSTGKYQGTFEFVGKTGELKFIPTKGNTAYLPENADPANGWLNDGAHRLAAAEGWVPDPKHPGFSLDDEPNATILTLSDRAIRVPVEPKLPMQVRKYDSPGWSNVTPVDLKVYTERILGVKAGEIHDHRGDYTITMQGNTADNFLVTAQNQKNNARAIWDINRDDWKKIK